jgi:hypothetical protein
MLTQKSLAASANLANLTTQLEMVNNQFHSTIETELDKLKLEESQLQAALKLKTRQSLVSTMERELEMNNFFSDLTGNSTALELTSRDENNSYLNGTGFNKSATLAESSQFLNSLNRNNNFVSSAIADYQTMNLNNLNKSIDLSEDGLRKSNALLDKLINDYNSSSVTPGSLRYSANGVSQFLKSAASDSDYKNRYLLNSQENIRPSVV